MTGNSNDTFYPRPPYAWFVVVVLLAAFTVSMVDRQILNLMVQPIRRDLGVSDIQISLLQGFAFVIFYSTFGVLLGRVADRHSRRNIIIIGMVVWCLATAGCGLSRNFYELFIARMFVGVGEATLSPAAYSMIADYFPLVRRARASSVYTMGAFVGAGLGMIFGGLAIAATSTTDSISVPLFGVLRSWQAAFLLVGIPGLLVAAVMLAVSEPVRREKGKYGADLSATTAFIRENGGILLLFFMAFGFSNMVNIGLAVWLPTFFIRNFGWSAGQVGTAYGVIMIVAGSSGIVTGGWVADRLLSAGRRDGALRTARWAVALLIPPAAIVGMASDSTVSLAALSVTTFFVAIPVGLTPVILYQFTPNEFRGQVIALNLLIVTVLGLALGPLLIASLTDVVFRDPHAVGKSLTVVTVFGAVSSLICLTVARRVTNRHVLVQYSTVGTE